jgi:hypothetical protein
MRDFQVPCLITGVYTTRMYTHYSNYDADGLLCMLRDKVRFMSLFCRRVGFRLEEMQTRGPYPPTIYISCNLLVFDSLVVSECTVENCVLQNFGQEYYPWRTCSFFWGLQYLWLLKILIIASIEVISPWSSPLILNFAGAAVTARSPGFEKSSKVVGLPGLAPNPNRFLTSPHARQSDMDCAIKENWRSLGERGQDLGEKRM